MTTETRWHPEAESELGADIDWYDRYQPGLGDRFETAVLGAVDASTDAPQTWPVWPGWDREPVARSKGVSGFPYRIVYFSAGGGLTIVAVAHEKRRPGYWRDRVER